MVIDINTANLHIYSNIIGINFIFLGHGEDNKFYTTGIY